MDKMADIIDVWQGINVVQYYLTILPYMVSHMQWQLDMTSSFNKLQSSPE